MSKVMITGLVNIETTMKVDGFPISYYPMGYPIFGIDSSVSGVGFNITKALHTLGDEVLFMSLIGDDEEGHRIKREVRKLGVDASYIRKELAKTPQSVILYEPSGRRQGHCDLKDIQEHSYPMELIEKNLKKCQVLCACNINFSRPLLRMAKEKEIVIATDVHVLEQIEDVYNREFMEFADIIFLSDEKIPYSPVEFILRLKNEYPCKIVVMGLGKDGAMLYTRTENVIYKVDAITVRSVVNTVGAGDALFSAFIHYYCKGMIPLEALKYAQCFASYKIGETGAANGFPSESMVEEIYSKCIFNIHKL